MRLLRLIAAFACIVLGAIVGALNTQRVVLDLGFATIPTSLGLGVLLALLLGWVVRAQRKQSTHLTAPVTAPTPAALPEEPAKNTFPDE